MKLPVRYLTACVIMAWLGAFFCGGAWGEDLVKLQDKILWIQVGNQIKDVDEAMLDKVAGCGFNRIILLHSSVNDQGYFPVLNSIVKRCHARGIRVGVGTIPFKDTYAKSHWEKNPDLRKCDKTGNYEENKYYHYQLCQNNPKNHEYIAGLLVKKAQESGADEIHIDYESTSCYCHYCVADFDLTCYKNARATPGDDGDWLVWRSRKARDFFEVLARKIYACHPGFMLSATAPFVGPPGGFTVYGIDIRYDDLTQYCDEFVPMIYLGKSQRASLAGDRYAAIQRRVKGKLVVPGLILNEEGTAEIKSAARIREEIESCCRAGASSLGIFEVRYINDENGKVLKSM